MFFVSWMQKSLDARYFAGLRQTTCAQNLNKATFASEYDLPLSLFCMNLILSIDLRKTRRLSFSKCWALISPLLYNKRAATSAMMNGYSQKVLTNWEICWFEEMRMKTAMWFLISLKSSGIDSSKKMLDFGSNISNEYIFFKQIWLSLFMQSDEKMCMYVINAL